MKIEDNFKYLVVDTGYTSRLVDMVDDIEDKIRDKISGFHGGKNCAHCENKILYIYDNDYDVKNKTHIDIYHSYNGKASERKHVKKIMNRKGIIVFKCDEIRWIFAIIDVLMNQNYCGGFCMESLIGITLVEDILVVSFDCESG
jgi:hypothetical protein